MRKLKIMEHISLDGVIQQSVDDDDFASAIGRHHIERLLAGTRFLLRMVQSSICCWPAHLRHVVGVMAEGAEQSDGRRPERGDQVCRDASSGESCMGAVRGRGARHCRRR
jgi:hypothetical protein